jgi:uncharacterized membrane protein YtjA (UPF0391 family)
LLQILEGWQAATRVAVPVRWIGSFFGGRAMLSAAFSFLIIALVAGALGLYAVEGLAANIAWILFIAFLVLAVLSLVFRRGRFPMD